MAGRVCVVTGASAGTGRAAALAPARMGARVELFLAGLSAQAEVRRLAAEVRERCRVRPRT